MIRGTSFLPFAIHGEELLAEGICAPQRHGGSAHGPVIGGELDRHGKVSLGARFVAGTTQMGADPEVEAGLFLFGTQVMDRFGGSVGGHHHVAVGNPSTNEVLLRARLDTGEFDEGIGSEGSPVGLDDLVVLIDPDHGRDIRDRVQLGNEMLGIDQDRIGDALSGLCNRLDVFVDGDGDDREVLVGEFVVKFLPPGQVKEASSPTRECDEELLLAAEVVESNQRAGQVRQGEVRSDEIVNGLST